MSDPATTSSQPLPEDRNDLGFGSVVSAQTKRRLLNKDGTFNVRRVGLGLWRSQSLYHKALSVSWPKFLLFVVAAYIVVNVVFSLLFLACGSVALVGADAQQMGGAAWRAFF